MLQGITNDRRSKPACFANAAGDLDRVVKTHDPRKFGRVRRGAAESMFGDGGIPYPAETVWRLRMPTEEVRR